MRIEEVHSVERRVLRYKHYIHTHPEDSWNEINTTQYIKEQLGATSIIEGIGASKTGVVFLVGDGSTKIFVRADMDALKTSSGPQHLCGHSTHTAALMGAYHWLKDHEQKLTAQGKQVQFFFQPAEESFPSGAKTALQEYPDIFSRSKYGFGLHVRPSIPVGAIQIDNGATWAANDIIQINVKGRSTHIKDAPKGIDAIDGATKVVQLFKDLQSQFLTFGQDIVFSFNVIRGGVSSNTIADDVFLKGSVRWTEKEEKQKVRQFFDNLPTILKTMYPGDISIEYIDEVPPACVNDDELVEKISQYMVAYSGFDVVQNGQVSLGSEDFSYYSKQNRTLFTHIGIESPYDLHNPRMVVSDEATLKAYIYWKNLFQWWMDQSV